MQKFYLEGTIYEYDGKLTVEDATFIYEKSGVGINRLNYELLAEGNPKVIGAFMFLLRRRAGEAIRWDDVKHWDLSTLEQVVDDPQVLYAQRERLSSQLALIEERLALVEAPSEPESPPADGERAADPTTPSGSTGKTRKRATNRT